MSVGLVSCAYCRVMAFRVRKMRLWAKAMPDAIASVSLETWGVWLTLVFERGFGRGGHEPWHLLEGGLERRVGLPMVSSW